METVLRALATYGFVWLIFRLTGKRSLSQITTFDFVLLLIISETTQQALVDDDKSMTGAFLLILTFFSVDLALSLVKQWSPSADKVLEGAPLLVLADGKPIQEHIHKERVDEADILEAARRLRGLERLDQIKYAVLECNGDITIVPQDE
jgi:uncharacterized membrane protein YcaP (DUF421 family)